MTRFSQLGEPQFKGARTNLILSFCFFKVFDSVGDWLLLPKTTFDCRTFTCILQCGVANFT